MKYETIDTKLADQLIDDKQATRLPNNDILYNSLVYEWDTTKNTYKNTGLKWNQQILEE